MAVKNVITEYSAYSEVQLVNMKKALIQKANLLLSRHEYYAVSIIKDDIAKINAQLLQLRKESRGAN